MVFTLYLKDTVIATLKVDAESKEVAEQKFNDGEYDLGEMEVDDRIGGSNWELDSIIKEV